MTKREMPRNTEGQESDDQKIRVLKSEIENLGLFRNVDSGFLRWRRSD